MDTALPREHGLEDFLANPDGSAAGLGDIVDDGDTRGMPLADVARRVDDLASLVCFPNLEPGARIGIAADNSADYVVACLAALRAGLVAVPINHRLPDDVTKSILADARCAYLLSDAQGHRDVGIPQRNLHAFVAAATGGRGTPPRSARAVRPGQRSADAFILYTSGSTGLPKGVPLTHAGFLWAISKFNHLRPLVEGRSIVIAAPLFHMNALFSTLLMLHLGARVMLLPRFEVGNYIRAVSSYQCPLLTVIPTMLARLAREPDLLSDCDLTSVRVVLSGSAPLTDTVLAMARKVFPQAQIVNVWGTTESGPACFGAHPGGLSRPPLSVGYPIADVEVRLVGRHSEDEGVLQVRNPAVMAGYLNRPQDTARCLQDGWYDTGDIMRRDHDGFYYFVGRADDMFVCSGENLYPREIEERLEKHPDVSEAAVVSIPDDVRGAIPVAFVVPKPSASVSEDAIKAFAIANGPAYAHPRKVFIVRGLPLAGTNKVDRRKLVSLALSHIAGQPSPEVR